MYEPKAYYQETVSFMDELTFSSGRAGFVRRSAGIFLSLFISWTRIRIWYICYRVLHPMSVITPVV